MTVIARVTSEDPHVMLVQLLTAPLGLDVWEVKPDHVVLQATEAQIERLEQMGYGVEQLHTTRRLPVDVRDGRRHRWLSLSRAAGAGSAGSG